MMTAQQLKNSILQRAIEGKLVEQRAEEGTAKDLLKEIKLEKEKLVKEGKIKKSKPLPDITEDEIPFDIPEGWEWVRFGEITINRDNERIPLSVNQREKLDKIYDYYGASGVIDKVDRYLFSKELLLIGEDGANLLMRSKPIAFIAKGKYWVNNHAHVIDCFSSIYMLYIMYYINAINLSPYVTGTAQPKMNQAKMNSIPVPLPPLSEQHRIVAKIEELLPLVDQYDKAYSQLTDLNEKFPQDMKKSILQYAIEGKLVEQRSEEGTAKELLKEIKLEKEKLIKEGKIKKSKPLPPITEDEIPFDIPDSWEWVRLGDIGITITGKTPATSHSEYYNGTIPFIGPGNISVDGIISYDSEKKITDEGLTHSRKLEKGDIAQVCIGGSIGKAALITEICGFNQQINAIKPNLVSSLYLYMVLISDSFLKALKANSTGTATPIINKDGWSNLLIPLPPLSEQHRIVERLEQLLPLCDKLVKTK